MQTYLFISYETGGPKIHGLFSSRDLANLYALNNKMSGYSITSLIVDEKVVYDNR